MDFDVKMLNIICTYQTCIKFLLGQKICHPMFIYLLYNLAVISLVNMKNFDAKCLLFFLPPISVCADLC